MVVCYSARPDNIGLSGAMTPLLKATRFEVAFKRARNELLGIREALGINKKSDEGEATSPVEQTIKGQSFSHIKDMETLADGVTALAADVREMRRDLLASPSPKANES